MSAAARREVEIVNQRGLHARASAALAREAARYSARVTVRHEDRAASAASIMDLMMLAASRGCVIAIEAEGADAEAAVEALAAFVAARFGEET
jgi:phosphocarrier protein